ncbi:deoxyguanosinetriphosphate triphosphohydrolase [Jiulongibacter sediminis]|uniref:Dehydrogenase n=1 Tax=Jiulongibacter sediminis TaxID=1605367 RepID=A0A0P7BTF5_9BACT|nr:deoxyguanosinetriphosphate triphosphohydrolase [Jiulongibacter sediminis]KPM47853.1 dehydrogenase [Jiulongibacter sediminis]TBX24037.1 dehydrogenase [Jiulongibacter sediminis]
MNWQSLFSNKRYGSSNKGLNDETRGEYLRDYDRLIFSSQFRRLQNKTQVFPLPGAVFVHNRLTHSLEVASVGRSLGRLVGEKLAEKYKDEFNDQATNFYRFELSDVVQTACLAHDIGNPPFGHSGEDAIRTFFRELPENLSQKLEVELSENQFNDLKNFEGNANAFRILSTLFKKSGLKLTYTSLASIVKYPVDSTHGFNKKTGLISTKKSGYFDAELEVAYEMANELQLITFDQEKHLLARHPFVFLVEAADDICYRIIDLEDAFRLNILSFEEVKSLLLPFFDGEKNEEYILQQMLDIKDEKQKLSLLRAMLINLLTNRCAAVFIENEEKLLNGELNQSLIDLIDEKSLALVEKIDEVSIKKIYNHKSVVEIEIAGFHVIGGLLKEFTGAVLDRKTAKSKKLLRLVPEQFDLNPENGLYQNLLSVIDFISGMTDLYAIDLYRKITGIQIPTLS